MSDDYYELLEVERTADDGTIKSSYRKLAMRFLPAKNPGGAESEAKFKACLFYTSSVPNRLY